MGSSIIFRIKRQNERKGKGFSVWFPVKRRTRFLKGFSEEEEERRKRLLCVFSEEGGRGLWMLSEEGGRVFSECYQKNEGRGYSECYQRKVAEFSLSVIRGRRKSFLRVLTEEGGRVFSECYQMKEAEFSLSVMRGRRNSFLWVLWEEGINTAVWLNSALHC